MEKTTLETDFIRKIKSLTPVEGDRSDAKKWLLCIGPCSEEVGENMKGLGYGSIKFSLYDKAIQWIDNYIIDQAPLPDAIICDTRLSGEDTFKKVRKLRRNHYFNNLVIILVSGTCDSNDKAETVSVGADDYYALDDLSYDDLDFRINFINQVNQSNDEADELKVTLRNKMNFSSSAKRFFDILVSGTALLILSPILLLIALLIKLDSKGPVFYISKRAGTGYQIFDFYKFRSMKTGADAELANLSELNKYDKEDEASDSGAPVFFKLKHDPRVTRIGHFLRKTSVDELPQLLNVLKGDMSLVGNRPLPLYEAELLTKDRWAQRFLAPAGITGLWQITKKGNNEMSPEERLALDIEYSETNSFWKDMGILIKTLPAAVQDEEQAKK